MELEYKEAKTVYDEDGKMYEWYGEKLGSGYLVRPVYAAITSYWSDGHEIPEYDVTYGKYTILEQVFDKPPVQKKEEKIIELESKIKKLEEEYEERQKKLKEIKWATDANPEEIIKKKLKHIPEIDYLLKALNNELKIYHVTSFNKIVCKNTDYVAIHLGNKAHPVHFFAKEGGGWKKYNCNDMEETNEETNFSSREEAEKFIIQRLLNREGIPPDIPLETVKELSSLFVKYGVPEPDYWQDLVKSRIKAKIEDGWDAIGNKYARIKELKEFIRNYEIQLQKGEETLNEYVTPEKLDILLNLTNIHKGEQFW